IITTCDHSMHAITKGNRKNSSGFNSMDDRCLSNSPRFASVLRTKNAGGFATCPKPQVRLALHRDAGAACCEGPFTLNRRGKHCGRHRAPMHSIFRREQLELPVHRIAQSDPVPAVPEGHAIVKALRFVIREGQAPGLSTVARLEDTG